MEPLPGVSGIDILLSCNNNPVARALLETTTPQHLTVFQNKFGDWDMSSDAPLTRANTVLQHPLGVASRSVQSNDLQVVLLIDGTALSIDSKNPQPPSLIQLLLDAETSTQHFAPLLTLCEKLSAGSNSLSCMVAAFGDVLHSQAFLASDLRPSYQLVHDGQFMPFSTPEMASNLADLEPTAGGDFVDALAEALTDISALPAWSGNSRKLIVLLGDSPAYSAIQPLRDDEYNLNYLPRTADLETALQLTTQNQIEIASIYLSDRDEVTGLSGDMRSAVRGQYERIASGPDYFSTFENFDPDALAERLIGAAKPKVFGRGYCPPLAVKNRAN